ncbi:MAG: hypothetical protein WD708_00440 [Kiritimatiellia bacterium]
MTTRFRQCFIFIRVMLFYAPFLMCRGSEWADKLKKLSNWEIAHAQYVSLSASNTRRNWPNQEYSDLPLIGNAWLISENPDGPSRFIVNGCEIREAYSESLPDSAQTADDRMERCSWMLVNVPEEIDRVIHHLQSQGNINASGSGRIRIDANDKGRFLLFASNASGAGYQKSAEKLITLLREDKDSEKIQSAAISQIADARYIELNRQWLQNGDKSAFQAGLASLIETFGNEWLHRPAAQKQLQSLRSPLTGADDVERDFLKYLDSEKIIQLPYRNWLLPNSGKEEKEAAPVAALLARRLDAVPFLVSLLEDYSPTKIFLQDNLGLSGPGTMCLTSWSYLDPILMKYVINPSDLLPRAVTRAEIAEELLQLSVWLNEQERKELRDQRYKLNPRFGDEKALHSDFPYAPYQRAVLKWRKNHLKMSDTELCRDYLRSQPYDPHAVMAYLVEHGNRKDIAHLEDLLLKDLTSYSAFGSLQPYVRLRKEQASGFLEKFKTAALSQVDRKIGDAQNQPQSHRRKPDLEELRKERDAFLQAYEELHAIMTGSQSVEISLNKIISGVPSFTVCEGHRNLRCI